MGSDDSWKEIVEDEWETDSPNVDDMDYLDTLGKLNPWALSYTSSKYPFVLVKLTSIRANQDCNRRRVRGS